MNKVKKVDASDLQLFLAKEKDGVWLSGLSEDAEKLKKGEKTVHIEDLMKEDQELPAGIPLEDALKTMGPPLLRQIHVLVVARGVLTVSIPCTDDKCYTAIWKENFNRQHIEEGGLPLVGDLSTFVERKLPVKIGIIRGHLNDSTMTVVARFIEPSQVGETKLSFIPLWNDVTCNVLNTVLNDFGRSNRDSTCSSTTENMRPDDQFLIDNVCVFQGEEKKPYFGLDIPRSELAKNLKWRYGDVPYLFGYTTVGYQLTLYAITRKPEQDERGNWTAGTHWIATFNLNNLEGRFQVGLRK